MESSSNTTKVSMTLRTSVYNALQEEAQKARMDFYDHMQRVLTEHVISTGSLPAEEAEMSRLFYSLVDRAVAAAKAICREGKFDEDITLRAIKRAKEDQTWTEDYAAYVQDDIYRTGNPRKGPINREIGFCIRAGIGGTVMKGPDGKSINKKVTGEIIQSYTPMASFDPDAAQLD